MRLVGRKEFLALPKGTVYYPFDIELEGGCLCVKEDSLDDDWYYSQLLTVDCDGSNEYWDISQRAEVDSGFSFPCDPTTTQRNGLFNESDRFVILDVEDVQKIIIRLQQALQQIAG